MPVNVRLDIIASIENCPCCPCCPHLLAYESSFQLRISIHLRWFVFYSWNQFYLRTRYPARQICKLLLLLYIYIFNCEYWPKYGVCVCECMAFFVQIAVAERLKTHFRNSFKCHSGRCTCSEISPVGTESVFWPKKKTTYSLYSNAIVKNHFIRIEDLSNRAIIS